jgi:hypothetical protein
MFDLFRALVLLNRRAHLWFRSASTRDRYITSCALRTVTGPWSEPSTDAIHTSLSSSIHRKRAPVAEQSPFLGSDIRDAL